MAAFDLLDMMFPGLSHQEMHLVLHICGLRDIDSQTCSIEFEGLEAVVDLPNYSNSEFDRMADRNSKRSPAAQCVQLGMARTNALKAVTYWVSMKLRKEAELNLNELTPAKMSELIREMAASEEKKDNNKKLYYPDSFSTIDYKNWIKKVENYLDARRGKAGVPLSNIIRPADANPNEAPDEHTRMLRAASMDTLQFKEDNREAYYLFRDLLTKTDGAIWFEKVRAGDGRTSHLLLQEHYVGEAHDMRRAAAANTKLSSGRVKRPTRSKST